jgi:hypothetical protein
MTTLCDIPTKVVVFDWHHLLDALLERRVNACIYSPLTHANEQLLSTHFIFSFMGYEVICSRLHLRRVILARARAGSHSDTLNGVFKGQPVILPDDYSLIPEHTRDELNAVLEHSTIALPGGTDIAFWVRDYLNTERVNAQIEDSTEEEGLRRLLVGNADLYVGGANHAHYLLREFPADCCQLARFPLMKKISPNRLWITKEFSDQSGISPSLLYQLWLTTLSVWRRLESSYLDTAQEPHREREEALAPRLVDSLARYLQAELNSRSRGRVLSFSDLLNLITEHNDFERVRHPQTDLEFGTAEREMKSTLKIIRRR